MKKLVEKLKINNRKEEFLFISGLVSSRDMDLFLSVVSEYLSVLGGNFDVGQGFTFCPFNDKLSQIFHGVNIYKNLSKGSREEFYRILAEEYFFLYADFVPPCCGDGRSRYCKSMDENFILECDRCNALYDLQGERVNERRKNYAFKRDFVFSYGEANYKIWPYHEKLQTLSRLS